MTTRELDRFAGGPPLGESFEICLAVILLEWGRFSCVSHLPHRPRGYQVLAGHGGIVSISHRRRCGSGGRPGDL